MTVAPGIHRTVSLTFRTESPATNTCSSVGVTERLAVHRGLLLLAVLLLYIEAMDMYDPKLCYILDGFLGVYGLIITGMFIKEKFFSTKVKTDESLYSELRGQDPATYEPLRERDPERGGRNRRVADDATYTDLNKRNTDGTYKELPAKREQRQRKGEQVYQGLSAATRDTYDALQMQPLPAR